jgi:cell volume regulation protein A
MEDVVPFGLIVLFVACGLLLAVVADRISQQLRVPAPALFLIAAAVASELWPRLTDLPISIDERIVTVALLLILFDGGIRIGWPAFRESAAAIVWLGIVGTLVTAAAMSCAAYLLLGIDWRLALLIGTALSPTDPAVVFSVLGRREIAGRSGTILEGESGANDPVSIALMAALLGSSGFSGGAVLSGIGEFTLQMAVGAAVGFAGGKLLTLQMRHLLLPNESLYPIRALAFAALIYGAATVLHGSGFLAVFLAGICIGDVRAPFKGEVERFTTWVASFAEILAFTILGLTAPYGSLLSQGDLWIGALLAVLVMAVVRPLLVGLVIARYRLPRNERAFILFAGLKGAVPILLGTYILSAGVPGASRAYGIIFIVVLLSVIVQGTLVPTVAKALRIPMEISEMQPYALGMRFSDEPQGLQRHVVAAGSRADGASVSQLELGEYAWISMVSRAGELVQVRGETSLSAGDEVLVLAEGDIDLGPIFGPPV